METLYCYTKRLYCIDCEHLRIVKPIITHTVDNFYMWLGRLILSTYVLDLLFWMITVVPKYILTRNSFDMKTFNILYVRNYFIQ